MTISKNSGQKNGAPGSSKRWISGIILVVLILYLVKEQDALYRLTEIKLEHVLALSLAYCVYFLTVSRRMLMCFGQAASGISFGRWFRIYLWGRTGNTVAPQAGTAFRAVTLKREFGISYEKYVAAFAFYAWSDMILNLIFGILVIFLWFRQTDVRITGISVEIMLPVLLALVVAAPILLNSVLKVLPSGGLKWYKWLFDRVTGVNRQFREIMKNRALALNLSVWTLASFILNAVVLYFAFRCVQVEMNVKQLVVFVALLNVFDFIQIIPGNVGISDLIFGIIAKSYGWDVEVGILVCLLMRADASLVTLILSTGSLRRRDFAQGN